MPVAKKTIKRVEKVEKIIGVKASVVGVDGKAAGSVSLPEAYFGAKPNKQLIAQAVRVYLANQRVGHAATKTRGMVEGSTRKIYKQKGTGRARHGAIRAPIFVGGGIVFGPQPRDYSLKFPQKMKRAALAAALSQQFTSGNLIIVSGFMDVKPKTKEMAKIFTAIGATIRTLLVLSKNSKNVVQGVKNLENVDSIPVTDMHTYGVMTHGKIVFMKEAVSAIGRSASG